RGERLRLPERRGLEDVEPVEARAEHPADLLAPVIRREHQRGDARLVPRAGARWVVREEARGRLRVALLDRFEECGAHEATTISTARALRRTSARRTPWQIEAGTPP